MPDASSIRRPAPSAQTFAYHDIAGQLAAAEHTAANGDHTTILLQQSQIFWLLPANGRRACIRCFQLWRIDRQSLNATAGAVTPGAAETEHTAILPLLQPMIECYLETASRSQSAWDLVRRIDLRTGECSDHPLLRHRECHRCDQSESDGPDISDPRTLAPITNVLRGASLGHLTASAFPGLVDERLGPIRVVTHGLTPAMVSVAEALTYAEDASDRFDSGYGRTGNVIDDPAIAVIEAAERYAGMRPRHRKAMVRATFDELGARAIDPELFILHTEAQAQEPDYGLSPYLRDREIDWVWAYSFRERAPRLIPAQLAYFALPPNPRGGRFVFEVSNGCAAGSTVLEAALFGLLEIIERDAFLASWYSNRSVTRIDDAGCNNLRARALLARLRAEGLQVEVFDIGVGLPAATLAVKVLDPERRFGPSMAYAAAAHVTAEGALVGALQEVATIFEPVPADARRANDERGRALLASPPLVKTMADHALQCWPEEAVALRSFNEHPTASTPWGEYARSASVQAPDQLGTFNRLLNGTLAHCHDVLLVDQSFEPARSNGLHFAKILAPGLLPMTFGHAYRRVSPQRMAQLGGTSTFGSYRQDPHVFP